MAVFRTVIRSDLQKPLVVQQLSGNMFTADNASNEIAVEVTNGGEPVALSGAVTAYAVRSDGVTAMFSGTINGNVASVVLPASCYVEVGTLSIVIKVGTTTVGACTCYVYRTTTDEIVDPGHVIPSIDELLEQIEACRTATTNANTAATNANAKAGLADTAAQNADAKATLANNAATLANTKAGLAETAATNANTAAGKIDNMTVAATGLPEGSAPIATISEVDGHKHIAFQIPKGDKGKDFRIAKTFASIAAMMAYTGTDLEKYDFAMIDTGSVEDPDTGKLYCYEPDKNPKWSYIGDLSGAQGIKGETGTGIDHVTLNNDYTLTIYYDDGTQFTTTSIRGATGITPNIAVGTVTTLLPDQQAYVARDPSSTAENPVFNFGIPKGDTGAVDNVYGTTVPMSESDSTTVADAIRSKLDKNQGTSNAGKFMKVGTSGELVPDTVPDPTNKADKVTNATAGNFAGLDTTGNLTDSGKSAEDFAGAIYKTATPGSIVSFEDGADDLPVKEMKIAIEPVQDLNGYDHPWPAGAVPNLIPDGTDTSNGYKVNYYLSSDGTETVSPSASFYISEYFPIQPNTIYTFSKTPSMSSSAPSVCFYDSEKTYISGVAINQQNEQQITTPANAVYARGTQRKDLTTGIFQFELGSTATELMPYSNICPIEGRTEANVTRTGKNLFQNTANSVTKQGLTYTVNSDGSVTVNGTATANSYLAINVNKTFAEDVVVNGVPILTEQTGIYIQITTDQGNFATNTAYGVTIPANVHINEIRCRINRDIIVDNAVFKPMIRFASVTNSEFEPYQGETYDITFPSEAGVVYGGNLTIHADGTGELVVDRTSIAFADSTGWTAMTTANIFRLDNGPLFASQNVFYENALTNNGFHLVGYSYTAMKDNCPAFAVRPDNNRLYCAVSNDVATASELSEWFNEHNTQLVAYLATPITYTLTAPQVRTLLGLNHIWADTGDITELIYPVNTDTAMALYEKADKVQNATSGNFAALDAEGNLKDSGKKPSDFLTQDQGSTNAGKFMKVGADGNLVPDAVPDPTGKADKVSGATNGNFAGLDANGNITDSGKKPSDFLTQHQDISGKVDKNQGTENAGKALGINNQGQVVPVPFSGEDFTGATPASAGTHGYVPAPQITDMTKFLCGDGTWADVAGGKLVTFELDEVTGTGGAYGHITYISSVTHDMKAVLIEVSDPEVFLDEISISCMDGGIALSCNNVNGTSTVTVSCLFKANPDNMTSSEFDVLSNRIGTLGNLKTTAKSNLVGAVNELYDDIAETKEDLEQTQDGLGIGADGDTHAAVSSGQFVYVRNHDTLANGLYKASAPISANGALSTSNLTPDESGGLNALKGDIDTLNSNIADITSRFEVIKVNSGLSKSIGIGGYGSFIVLGFAQGIGGVAIAVAKSSNTITAYDFLTGTTWSNSKLTFTVSGSNVVISSAQAGDSILTIVKGSV